MNYEEVVKQKVVHKYELNFQGKETVVMCHDDSVIVHADVQHRVPHVWMESSHALTDDQSEFESKTLQIFGTGELIPKTYIHRKTFLDGLFVWHLYEKA